MLTKSLLTNFLRKKLANAVAPTTAPRPDSVK